jgi:hypothetical protein
VARAAAGGKPANGAAEPALERIVVLFSVDDPPTERLGQRILTSRLMRGLRFEFCYAMDRYGRDDRPDADVLFERVDTVVQNLTAQALIVHHGVAFQRAPGVYAQVIERLRDAHRALVLATDAAPEPGPFTLEGVHFEQPVELHEIVRLIFG